MKFALLFIWVSFSLAIQAQTYEWLATGRNLTMEVTHASLSSERKFVVAAEMRTTEYIDGKTELVSFAKTKDTSTIIDTERMHYISKEVLIQFDPDGMIEWQFELGDHLLGIQHNNKNEILLMMSFSGEYTESEIKQIKNRSFTEENEEEEGEEDENTVYYADLHYFKPGGNVERFIPSGLYVMVLNSNGYLIRTVPLIQTEDLDLDILDFKISPQGNLVFHGVFGDDFILDTIRQLPAKAGGDFVLSYSADGKYLWGDFLRYDRNSCCSNYADVQSMCIAPDGSVYLAGAYNKGLILSNGTLLKVSEPATELNKEPFESYLIAYSPTGKMLWAKQSESQTMVHKIAASNDHVYISYYWNGVAKKPFQIDADTTNKQFLVIAAFTKKGKFTWSTSHGAARVQDLEFKNNQLFVAGATRFGANSNRIGNYTLQKIEGSYIAVYTPEGKFLKVTPLKTDFDDRARPVFMYPVSNSEIYLAFSMFVGMRLPLRVYDKIFQDIKNSANCGVVGRIRY